MSVAGTWTGQSIMVEQVEPVAATALNVVHDRPIPCSGPSDGWPDNDFALDSENVTLPVEQVIAARPDRFSGHYRAYPLGDPHSGMSQAERLATYARSVLVVGTLGDEGAVQAELALLYPHNLCVHRVPFSRQRLEEASMRLVDRFGRSEVAVDIVHDRVRVRVPVIDQSVLDELGADSELVAVDPLVIPQH